VSIHEVLCSIPVAEKTHPQMVFQSLLTFLLIYPAQPPVESLNCHRCKSTYLTENVGHNYHLNLHSCHSDKISHKRLFQTIPQNNNDM
jgi:hypothetical protein